MSSRNRVIYQSEGVYVSQDVNATGVETGDFDVASLYGIQNANYSFSISRQDVNCFGQLASVDRIITETPTVSFDTSYYLANFGNEKKLGFHIWADQDNTPLTPVSCISGLINSETNDGVKNIFILTTKEGADVANNTESGKYESIIGIGNASITSYSTEGAVGGLPTVSVSAEGQNMNMVNTPYTASYDGITGAGAANTGPYWGYPTVGIDGITAKVGNFDGAGFETVGEVVFTVTGAPSQTAYTANADNPIQWVEIQSGNFNPRIGPATTSNSFYNRTGIQDTIPAGSSFTNQDGTSSAKITLTLENEAVKGDRRIYAKLGGAGAAGFTSGLGFTGTFNDVVSYISGSNPSVDSADGELNLWQPNIGNTSEDFLGSPTDVRQVAPVKLPVAPSSLTSSNQQTVSGVAASGSISVLRPGDITITLKKKSDGNDPNNLGGIVINSAPIQSYNISFDLTRTPLQKIGTKFAYARPVDFPITSSFNFDAIVTDLATGDVANIIDCDDEYNATVMLKDKNCGKNQYIMAYEVRGLKVDDQSYSTSLGDNKTVSYSFTSQIGGPDQPAVGVFMSGYYTDNATPYTPE